MAIATLILGGNSIDKDQKIKDAIALLASELGTIKQMSSIYETAAWGYESSNTYYNQVVIVSTNMPPQDVLNITQEIEKRLGRNSKSANGIYTDRPIDIDILFYNDISITTDRLTIPHPHISERRFVLVPLNEVLPNFIHPTKGKTVKYLFEKCTDNLDVVLLEDIN